MSSYRQGANNASSEALEKLLERTEELVKAGELDAIYDDEFIEICAAADLKLFFKVTTRLRALKRFSIKIFTQLVKAAQRAMEEPADAHVNEAWKILLKVNSQGAVKSTLENVMVALRNAPDWEGVFVFDQFAARTVKIKKPPFRVQELGPWTDQDDVFCAEWMQRNHINVGVMIVAQAVEAIATENRVHPVREYLQGLKWAGVSRLDNWLPYYVGVEPSDYVTAIGRKWMISAVARVLSPGCQADACLILESQEQGIRKSTFLKALAIQPEWFTDQVSDLANKDSSQDLQGKWIIEFSEIESFSSKHEAGVLKKFISRPVDHYRASYGRRVQDFPRQCIFAGSTNKTQYLTDETGGRRYWPVVCGDIRIEEIRQDRDQLWAEAVHLYQQHLLNPADASLQWWFEPNDPLLPGVRAEQASRIKTDPWDEKVWDYVSRKEEEHIGFEDGTNGWALTLKRRPVPFSISTGEVLENALNKKSDTWSATDQGRIAAILLLHGYERKQCKIVNDMGVLLRDAEGEPLIPWRYRRKV